jgi:uncharacterized protein YneF (UPF0154 family)
MIRSSTEIKIVGLIVAVGAPIVLAAPAFAAGGDVAQVESFIRNVIKVIAGLAGLVATGFFVARFQGNSPLKAPPKVSPKASKCILSSKTAEGGQLIYDRHSVDHPGRVHRLCGGLNVILGSDGSPNGA